MNTYTAYTKETKPPRIDKKNESSKKINLRYKKARDILAYSYRAVLFEDDKNPSKPFNTLPHWLGSCK